jgi:hypothetical protein
MLVRVHPTKPDTLTRARTQARFLACFEVCGQVLKASRWAKVPRSEHYRWLEEDPTYPTRFEAADMKFTREPLVSTEIRAFPPH